MRREKEEEEGRKEEEKCKKSKGMEIVWNTSIETLVRMVVWKFCWKILV